MSGFNKESDCDDDDDDDDEALEQAISMSLQSGGKELIKIQVKWKSDITFTFDVDPDITTVGILRGLLERKSGVLKKHQKLIGLTKVGGKPLDDSSSISSLGCKIVAGVIKISMIGSTLSEIESVSSTSNNGATVVNDLTLNISQNTREWSRFQEVSQKVEFNIINQPREGKKLLVLDLDHTLLHFTSKGEVANERMKRPFMNIFLTIVYNFYDIVFWSQTSWRWIEIKLAELGMVPNPGYKVCFVLDKHSMFSSTDGKLKPLSIIWNKFKHWDSSNSLHVDDLERNFQLNKSCGIVIPPYNRLEDKVDKMSVGGGGGAGGGVVGGLHSSSTSGSLSNKSDDIELLILARYLVEISDIPGISDTEVCSHKNWRDNSCNKLLADLTSLASSSHSSSSSSSSSSNGSSSSTNNTNTAASGGIKSGGAISPTKTAAASVKQHFFEMIAKLLQNIE